MYDCVFIVVVAWRSLSNDMLYASALYNYRIIIYLQFGTKIITS